jgi:peptidyl-prolyl cis-trans isomerase SurA
MIIDKLQRQLADRAGITVSEEMLNSSAVDIAQRNNMNIAQFRAELEKQGIPYRAFLENMRNEIIVNQIRSREIGSRIKVTDAEVNHALETQGKIGDEVQYHLGHILIAVREGASAADIKAAQTRADDLVSKLRAGQDFSQAAFGTSGDNNALQGGDLGWRSLSNVPTLFVDVVPNMKQGDVSNAIRSPSGFHILKVLERKGGDSNHVITKTKVRHILIKTNELIDDNEARKRLLELRERIVQGDDFAALAKAHSDDKGSAIKGGSLDWVNSGDLVKPFEEVMNKLDINQISEPLQTQFGWHLIQVLGRENQDNSSEYKKNLVRDALRKRKVEEETELWLRRLRDEAFVEIHDDRL